MHFFEEVPVCLGLFDGFHCEPGCEKDGEIRLHGMRKDGVGEGYDLLFLNLWEMKAENGVSEMDRSCGRKDGG